MLYNALDPTYPAEEAAATIRSVFRATNWLAERIPDPPERGTNTIHNSWLSRAGLRLKVDHDILMRCRGPDNPAPNHSCRCDRSHR